MFHNSFVYASVVLKTLCLKDSDKISDQLDCEICTARMWTPYTYVPSHVIVISPNLNSPHSVCRVVVIPSAAPASKTGLVQPKHSTSPVTQATTQTNSYPTITPLPFPTSYKHSCILPMSPIRHRSLLSLPNSSQPSRNIHVQHVANQ